MNQLVYYLKKVQPDKIINGFCYQQDDKIIFIDLYYEKTNEYRKKEFEDFIVKNEIDETSMILSNRINGIVTPLYKYSCISFLKKKKVTKLSHISKDELIDIC